jgi:mannose-6-phosphate isomerase-like protein (cupin superfamily)
MEHVSHESVVKHANSPNCIVFEYPMKNSEMNIAVAEITRRYPDEGYAVNHKCCEMGYILKGSGKLVTETREVNLSMGDALYISPGEKYYWEGNMTVVMPCAPAWFPQQHEIILSTEKVTASS